MSTNQEIFDTVVRHLYTQRKQAALNGNCKYRAPGGLKCAVGCLIPDDKYTADMDDPQYNGLPIVLSRVGIHSRHKPLLVELQTAHDRAGNWNSRNTAPLRGLGVELARIAERFKLKTSVLEEVSA